ncbi:hypothetical protein BDV26DRAFT_274577 [Aspergillus bertholletiae]|uniref:Uncharacterized protein n=1 Tax=Aspergillus bertholletiae TaxID=1226010 RepID=A0A5N7ASD4_9EURO|nr:hypothetical protein BDV26DRAFT_274577 [Aspergillus bertholletiae]
MFRVAFEANIRQAEFKALMDGAIWTKVPKMFGRYWRRRKARDWTISTRSACRKPRSLLPG